MSSLLKSIKSSLGGSSTGTGGGEAFQTAKTEADLFVPTKPEVDGEECLRDCEGCTTKYPSKFKIDEDDRLYGHVKGWNTHLIVGTGKTDWVRDVTDEKHSVMHAVGKAGVERKNGKVMLSASNMPPTHEDTETTEEGTADCLLLPAWVVIEQVAPSKVETLLKEVVETSPTNTTPLTKTSKANEASGERNGHSEPNIADLSISSDPDEHNHLDPVTLPASVSSSFRIRPIPHDYLILMCSHKTRDARCGQSAPLLRKEFERVLRPLGLYRDLQDDRPGGVGIYFINHVGGHKYSANVMIYRRAGRKLPNSDEDIDGAPLSSEAVQLIWLARVRPEDCENIVRYTVLQGKVVKPNRQLRGGFDRERGVTSW
jgi:hypothetical protein